MRWAMVLAAIMIGGPAVAGTLGGDPACDGSGGMRRADAGFVERCRSEWLQEVEKSRRRVEAFRANAIAVRNRGHVSRSLGQGPVTLDRFLSDDLSHGDIVVTSRGPMVFIGHRGEVATLADFVPVGHKRSPAKRLAPTLQVATY